MHDRTEIMKKFRAMRDRSEPIIGGGAGTGLSAKCEEAGGIDLIVIYLSLIHISEPTRLRRISYAVFCLKKKTNTTKNINN